MKVSGQSRDAPAVGLLGPRMVPPVGQCWSVVVTPCACGKSVATWGSGLSHWVSSIIDGYILKNSVCAPQFIMLVDGKSPSIG